MATKVTAVRPETPVSQVVSMLLQAPFRALPVVDEQRHLLGLITTGDLIRSGALPLRRGLIRTALALDEATAAQMRAPLGQAGQSARTAAEAMNRQVRTVRPEQSLREAARLMAETGLRRLPVVDAEGHLIGMLSRTDLLRAIVSSPLASGDEEKGTSGGQVQLASSGAMAPPSLVDYVRREVATVHEETPLAEVLDSLLRSPLKRVVVVDDERHVRGIISDVDVLAHLQAEQRPRFLSLLSRLARGREKEPVPPEGAFHLPGLTAPPRRASDVMNRSVVTVLSSATVQEAIASMMRTGRKVLPVVDDDGRLVGIVGRSDLLRVLLEDDKNAL
jgi:CBS domain-containing protein